MAIKPTGSGPPIAPTQGVSGVARKDEAKGASFSSAVEGTSSSKPAAEADPVRLAVRDVAAEIDAGRVQPGEQAIDRVIERIVHSQAAPGTAPAELRDRVAESQFLLGDDPFFVERVERLLEAERSA